MKDLFKLMSIGILVFLVFTARAFATTYVVNPSNYINYVSRLQPGDTMLLEEGDYTQNLQLRNVNGNALQPVVIMGKSYLSRFIGQSCCNTVSISQCSYLILRDFGIYGNNEYVDAIKAEGTAGNWAHHITIENINIYHPGVDQQVVCISTKCPAWDWIIRNNLILQGGTGLYLGNSDGTRPFVNGIIENNLVVNSVGYNLQVKHQFDGVRDSFSGTQVHGKTIIRDNVFIKAANYSTGGNARPNVLVGGFPKTGWGSKDYYEIYGNLFYQNPVEALFQATGHVMLYGNIFINHENPGGFRAIYFTPQNQVSPGDIRVFHNTVLAANSSGGIRLNSPDPNYKQYCQGNAVFATAPITNFNDTLGNITGNYDDMVQHVISVQKNLQEDFYPLAGKFRIPILPSDAFKQLSDFDKDFNNDVFDWTYCGAYTRCCENKGWKISETRKALRKDIATGSDNHYRFSPQLCTAFPNPVKDHLMLHAEYPLEWMLFDEHGSLVLRGRTDQEHQEIQLAHLLPGMYFMRYRVGKEEGIIPIMKN